MRFGSAAARWTESPPTRRFPCLEFVIVYEKAYSKLYILKVDFFAAICYSKHQRSARSDRGCDSGADAAPGIPKEKRKRKKENVT